MVPAVRAGEAPRPAERAALHLRALHRVGVPRASCGVRSGIMRSRLRTRVATVGARRPVDDRAHRYASCGCARRAMLLVWLACCRRWPLVRGTGTSAGRRRPSERYAAPAAGVPSDDHDARHAGGVTTDPDARHAGHRRSPAGTSPHRRTVPIEWAQGEERACSPARSRCRSTTPTRRPARSRCTSCATRRDDEDERIGTLLVNPGGPGFGGTVLRRSGRRRSSTRRCSTAFDIVGWDPRGTGQSDPGDRLHRRLRPRTSTSTDITPDTHAETPAARRPGRGVRPTTASTKNADILQYVGTNNRARDMDAIRQALGEDDDHATSGSATAASSAATWATLFPDTVRAAVLDGAADPNADSRRGQPAAERRASRRR